MFTFLVPCEARTGEINADKPLTAQKHRSPAQIKNPQRILFVTPDF